MNHPDASAGVRRAEPTGFWLLTTVYCFHHRVEDFHVAGAAAEITGESFADVGLGRVGHAFEEADGGEHHARRADAALRGAALAPRLLPRGGAVRPRGALAPSFFSP